ncbi:MAG: hypothetical protein IMF06_11130 [Proteobacteria bacterium]|nr:hypothetical protein [Pseudomonadota bacterium]
MNPLAAAHIMFIGLWGGLVLVEIAFEVQMFRGRMDEKAVAALHRITDRLLELPILFAVLVTGWMLWKQTGFDHELLPKVMFGLGAVVANAVCYVVVEMRASEALRAANSKEVSIRIRRLSIVLASTIAPGLLSGGIALFLGGQLIGWW